MSRPTWVIFYAIFIILIGGCSLMSKVGDTQTGKLLKLQESILENTDFESEITINNNEDQSEGNDHNNSMDSLDSESIKETNERIAALIGDTLVLDENDNVDIKATFINAAKMSDYRITWIQRFGWIGIFTSLMFILGGVLMWRKSEIVIPFILTLLSTSMAVSLFQYFIFKADQDSGNLTNIGGKFEVIWSIALDAILLIVFMVVDKSYFSEEKYTEDFN